MRTSWKKKDRILFIGLLAVLVGLPLSVWSYDRQRTADLARGDVKVFTLTGHARLGWLTGEAHGYDVVSFWAADGPMKRPELVVHKGDRVIIRLRSADVVHGFSLKDFGILITDGIKPGTETLVKFTADKVGRFQFSCNNICGDKHANMIGYIVVRA